MAAFQCSVADILQTQMTTSRSSSSFFCADSPAADGTGSSLTSLPPTMRSFSPSPFPETVNFFIRADILLSSSLLPAAGSVGDAAPPVTAPLEPNVADLFPRDPAGPPFAEGPPYPAVWSILRPSGCEKWQSLRVQCVPKRHGVAVGLGGCEKKQPGRVQAVPYYRDKGTFQRTP